MKAVIISIGDEILIGQVVNTNAAFISEKLNSIGIEIIKIITVGDVEEEIINSFQEHYGKADIIIVTGGLGPTHDDVTRKAVCKFFNVKLVQSNEVRKYVKSFLQKRNRHWSKAAEDQTYIPEGAQVIPNKYGTAAGEFFSRNGKYFIVMPGVPYEMESMVEDFIIPYFKDKIKKNFILHRTLMTTGIPESVLSSKLGDINKILKGEKLAFLPSPSGVRLRITVKGLNKKECKKKIEQIEKNIRSKIQSYIYGVDDEQLEEIVGKLLTSRKLKIAVAESCTGGLIANKITNVPGSSVYFDRGLVTYSNKSKIQLLNVAENMIKKHGAVSKEVAKAMAQNIRQLANVDIGISTTGIAGPTGATPNKPIGLVWIGYSDKNETRAIKFYFGDNRLRVKERAAQAAMDLIRRKILKI